MSQQEPDFTAGIRASARQVSAGNLHELCEGGRSLGWLSERATTCEQAVSHQAFQARRPGYDLSGVLRGTPFAGLLSL